VVIKTVVELNVPKGIVDVPVVHAPLVRAPPPIREVVVAIADRLYPFTITGVAVLESFRFSGAETGSTADRDWFAECPSGIGRDAGAGVHSLGGGAIYNAGRVGFF
jgi:hypothetical protein